MLAQLVAGALQIMPVDVTAGAFARTNVVGSKLLMRLLAFDRLWEVAVAHAEIQGEARVDLPVVLNEDLREILSDVRCESRGALSEAAVGIAEK